MEILHKPKAILFSVPGVNSGPVILNVFQQMYFAESDFKPRLWRKVAEAEKDGVRKVRAMWTVRKPLTPVFTYHMFEMELVHFQTIQLFNFTTTHIS